MLGPALSYGFRIDTHAAAGVHQATECRGDMAGGSTRADRLRMAKGTSICEHRYIIEDMTLRVATTILAVLIGAGPAPAQWRDATSGDEEKARAAGCDDRQALQSARAARQNPRIRALASSRPTTFSV
jgi:hypothetical protein